MSDDLDIRGGGAVAVDTQTLRAVADRFGGAAIELEDVCVVIASAAGLLYGSSQIVWPVAQSIDTARARGAGTQGAADRIAADLREAAAVYETIELRAERDIAAAGGDDLALQRVQQRLRLLARDHPDAAAAAGREVARHWWRWPAELSAQAPGALWWLGPGYVGTAGVSVWGMLHTIRAAGWGTVSRADLLRGPAQSVTVAPVRPVAPAAPFPVAPVVPIGPIVPMAPSTGPNGPGAVAPPSLAAAASRIPGGGESRIRVERYKMADGSRQFAVYVAGTQTVSAGSDDPFDMRSNLELYTGERSASFEATLQALTQSGAEPGDVVHAFGHSQGAMVAAHLALEGGYDTRTLVTFGSPVEADVGTDTLSVALRHRDDPVAALAGGGHAGAVGAAGSFVAERSADPAPGLHDWELPAHGIAGYRETAEMLDASGDPRMIAVRTLWDDLASAESVEVVEYSAARVLPVSAPSAPGPLGALSPSSASSDAG